ncbi:hypothetical protein TI03_04500 [Achromatium sp. WMS1]|nr:hypothetical protein TI03_04500 [Achromatium sp. WMS1]
MNTMCKNILFVSLMLVTILLGGCASTKNTTSLQPADGITNVPNSVKQSATKKHKSRSSCRCN